MSETHILSVKTGDDEIIYNKKYKKVLEHPIGSGTYSSVYLVKNIFNEKKYYNLI